MLWNSSLRPNSTTVSSELIGMQGIRKGGRKEEGLEGSRGETISGRSKTRKGQGRKTTTRAEIETKGQRGKNAIVRETIEIMTGRETTKGAEIEGETGNMGIDLNVSSEPPEIENLEKLENL